MKRRLFNLLSAVSLLLCIGMVALAVLCRYRSDTIGWAGWRNEAAAQWHGWGMNSEGARISIYYFRFDTGRFDDPTNLNGSVPDMLPHAFHHVMGSRDTPGTIICKWIPYSPSLTFYFFGVPQLLLAGVFAMAPLTFLAQGIKRRVREHVRNQRLGQGCCDACGYDLRGSADRCPECGRPRIETAAA